jgi:hypothetical protein
METVYGISIAEEGDPYVKMAEEAVKIFEVAGLPGAFLVDTIPICMCATSSSYACSRFPL